jgi:hypothetical protein
MVDIIETGLDIPEEQFLQLKQKDQNVVIYRNLKDIRVSFSKNYSRTKFQIKLQWIWLGILTILVGAGKFLGVI